MRLLAAGFAVCLLAASEEDPKAPNFELPDLEGKNQSLSDLKGRKAVILIFGGIECPRSRFSEPRLGDMAPA